MKQAISFLLILALPDCLAHAAECGQPHEARVQLNRTVPVRDDENAKQQFDPITMRQTSMPGNMGMTCAHDEY